MFSKIERMIAFRYLRSRRREGFISVIAGFSFIGIALGVATLIVVMAVMNGFRAEITNKILGVSGHIYISSYEREIRGFDELTGGLTQIEGVKSLSPIIDGQAMVTTKYTTTGAVVKGIRLLDVKEKPLIADNIKDGDIEDFALENRIILGSKLANRLGVFVGEKVTLISPKGRATALGTMPKLKSYYVAAIFEAGMYEYDNNIILMPLESAQLFFSFPDSVNSIEIMTDNPQHSELIVRKIESVLEGLFIVSDWKTSNATLFNALKVERTVMFLILTLIVFIAAFNIISSLIMLVNDKSNDIAILRTIGATRGMILRIFFLCGASIGVVGTLLGFILGISFASNIESIRSKLESITGNKLFDPVIYFLSELPSDIQATDVAWSVGMGLLFSFLATIYPAYKAARQDPAEALRYE
ncbi:MAG: lipoprotein-releasing ABC transporter permease subunit [Rickettsiales bacterium]|nr:lipoprotein-releasing ABC transporter permease subunit [Pseudomonadota bacterium]MDA0965763.1 lipoprotein-releasing ABC transporter permease subunit [Pseudomonadota bacterium]MDG4543775.1 lipoprotein-releasing ABC transporter permease subunit [Rickettsiales bacterium]MDG4545922.1 lipoprotein-releasing ABC transporter permease subunit [Rickettsiales bacterium]MDG4548168.1 lipoprotein-releasing ABC transporter permease subunit [Rickettsiales bacterium]